MPDSTTTAPQQRKKGFCSCCSGSCTKNIQEDEHSSMTRTPNFTHELTKGLKTGQAIQVQGVIQPGCPRFAVNLACALGPTANIGLHFNPRLSERYVVRNSKIDGSWGTEETSSSEGGFFPFIVNEPFKLTIFITDKAFLVSVNDRHFCTYQHRIPFAQLKVVEANGLVEIKNVDGTVLEAYPTSTESYHQIGTHGSMYSHEILKKVIQNKDKTEKYATPLTYTLPKGFPAETRLEIYGRVKLLPNSFYINLQDTFHIWPHPIIPLHVNARFFVGGKHFLIRNAWYKNDWGQEERVPLQKLQPGADFCIGIERFHSCFLVFIDDKLVGEFQYRGDTENCRIVHIRGDIYIYKVILNKKIIHTSLVQ